MGICILRKVKLLEAPRRQVYKCVLFPFSEMRYSFFWKNSSPRLHKFQVIVSFLVLTIWIFLNGAPLRYFFFKIWLRGWPPLLYNFHIIFPPRAMLYLPRSMTSKPPSTIGCFTVSQFTKWYFFWLFFPPHHRKSLINLETCLIIVFGARRKDS